MQPHPFRLVPGAVLLLREEGHIRLLRANAKGTQPEQKEMYHMEPISFIVLLKTTLENPNSYKGVIVVVPSEASRILRILSYDEIDKWL